MFTLDDKDETYWYPVPVEMISKEDGRKQKFTFDAEFARLPQDEIDELFRKREDDEPALKDEQVVAKVFRGWRKVQDADGSELAVNDENRERLLKRYPVQKSIVMAYLKSIGIEGRLKN